MVLEIITLGAIGVIYLTGDKERKDKLKKIGSGVVDVTKDVTRDVAEKTKTLIKKYKAKKADETNNN